MTQKKRLLLTLLVLSLLFSIIWFRFRPPTNGSLKAVGLIEGQEINISSKIFGRIITLPYEEGDLIKKGSLVVKLEARELKAQIKEAEEEVKRAKAVLIRLGKEKNAAEAQFTHAQEKLHQAEINRDQAKRDYQRAENLWKQGIISQEVYDRAQTAYLALEANVKAVSAEVEASARQLEAIQGQIEEAKAQIAYRQASVRVLETRLEDSLIFSPLTGLVAKKYFEIGETVSPGVPILTLWNLKKIWAKVYLDEKTIPLITLGMPAQAQLEFLPQKLFKGKVVAIAPEGEFSTQRDVKRGRQDIRAFRIKVALQDPAGILKPGMSVQVEFQRDEQYH
jgi:HlyD family secretion protein